MLELFFSFVRYGFVAFGGGYSAISLIYQDILRYGWVSTQVYADIVAIAQITPGPVALNTATYLGKIFGGFWGALSLSLALVVPALLITELVVLMNKNVDSQNKFIIGFLSGMRAGAIGLIFSSLVFFADTSVFANAWGSIKLHFFSFHPMALLAFGTAFFLMIIKNWTAVKVIYWSLFLAIIYGFSLVVFF